MVNSSPHDGQLSLADVLESIADPVVAFDKQWRYTYVSRRAAQILGMTPEEMTGKSMWELFPADADTGFQEACQRAWRDGKPVTVERYSAVLGVWVESYIYPFENGASTQWRDITEHKLAEEALRASEERNRLLAELLERADQPFGIGYPDGRLGFINPAFERLTGYSRDELQATDWAAVLTPPEWVEAERAKLEELQRTGRPVRYEKEYLRKDGTRVPIELLVHLAKDDRGQAIYYSFLTDVSERKRAEEERARVQMTMEAERRLLDTVVANIPTGVDLVRGSDLTFLLVNPAYQASFPGKQILGKTLREVWPELHPALEEIFRRVLETGEPYQALDTQYLIRRSPTGPLETAYFTWSLIRVRIPGEEGWGLLNTTTETTERVRAGEDRQRQREWLRVTLSSIGDAVLAADAAGKITFLNPAAAGLTGWTEQEALGRPARDVFRIINEQTRVEAEDIIARVLRERRVVPLANHTALVSRDGREIPVEDSAAPIEDSAGNLLGVVLVFHDVTEERRAQEALQESEEQFRTLANAIPQLCWMANADGWIFWYNERWYQYTGSTPEQMAGWGWQSVHDPAALPQVLERWQSSIATGEPFDMTFPLRGADGVFRPFLTRVMPVRDRSGKIVRWFGSNTDVTEQRRTEEALREERTRLRLALDASNAGTWEWDLRTNEHIWSEELWKVYGLESHSCQPSYEAWLRIMHPEDRARAEQIVQESARNGTDMHVEFRVEHRGGAVRWLMAMGHPVRDGAGAVERFIGIAIDITRRKRAEEEARRREAILEAFFDASPAILRIEDEEFRFLKTDRLTPAYFGLTRQSMAGKSMAELAPEFVREYGPMIREVIETGQPRLNVEVHSPVPGRSGEMAWWLASYFPVPLPEGKRGLGMVGVEITELKKAEERLRQAQKLESLGLLAGGVAHDFNNLLVGVIGNASLAQETLPPGHEAVELLESVVKTGEQAAHLTRQMLAYAGKGKFLVEPLDLSQLIPEISGLVRPSISKKIALQLKLHGDLPPIEADRGQLQQVFMNLAINAAEAIGSHDGLISVRTGLQEVDDRYLGVHPELLELRPGAYVYLEVRDTGSGMDEATRARIFDPFFSTKFTGRGLGLAAVAGIVRGHHGAITVASAPGKGSCFTVLFPAVARGLGKQPPAARHAGFQGSGTVLVVDDEKIVRDLAKAALERHGYKVLLADNGLAALDVFRRFTGEIALVLLDLSMPVMSGEDALPELRKIRPEVKVLVSSGFSEAETMALFAGRHVAGFIQKPYTANALAERVRSALV